MALLILGVCELRIVTEQIHIKGSASHEGLKYINMHHISDFWLGVILSGHKMSRNAKKPVFGVSDQVRHKPACTVIEPG